MFARLVRDNRLLFVCVYTLLVSHSQMELWIQVLRFEQVLVGLIESEETARDLCQVNAKERLHGCATIGSQFDDESQFSWQKRFICN